MSLESLYKLHSDNYKSQELFDALRNGTNLIQIDGLAEASKSWILSGVYLETERPVLLLTYNNEQAERITEDLSHYDISKDQIIFFPESDTYIYQEGAPDFRVVGERLAALQALSVDKKCIVVAPISAALRKTMSRQSLKKSCIKLEVGASIDLDEIISNLVKSGYTPTDIVDRHGEYSRRGGLIDVYASNEDNPLRIELFGDEIESIRHFDSTTQRSIDKLSSVVIMPAREIVLDKDNSLHAALKIKNELKKSLDDSKDLSIDNKLIQQIQDEIVLLENQAYFDDLEFYLPYLHPEENSIFDYILPNSIIILDEPTQIKSFWEQHKDQINERLAKNVTRSSLLSPRLTHHVPFESTLKKAISIHQSIAFALLARSLKWIYADLIIEYKSSPIESYAGKMEAVIDQIKTWAANNQIVIIATAQSKRFFEILTEYNIVSTFLEDSHQIRPGIYIAQAPLRSGYKINDVSLMVITDSEIFGVQRMHRQRKASHEGVPISSILDIKEGDYVVHINHGIGFYRGIQSMINQGVEREYLILQYAGNDTLYVPTDQIDRVQKYIGGEGNAPTVHKLGGSEWQKATKKVKKAVEEMAKELVELYAWRESTTGNAYSSDTPWQQEMESAFPYTETPDQYNAIKDVKRDLERAKPMDRLICGDVGYGKTEVAIRAAFKVAADGKQVAILAPTTVLAQQHFNTFSERLAAFPIKIAQLSRFRTKKEQAETIEGVKYGTVDIVIGTHRLLSKDVTFKNLGLLVIDEEQRFGVRHKEKLKQLRKNVDVLTMTATPIPRTLHMSLAGIRNMSIINDPPEGRVPIKTFVRDASAETIRNAIIRELDRGGQVFFVHNRVENIGHVADQIQKLVPYARIDTAHGQMSEAELEQVMMDFYEHKFDILICTTIIESGLDVPNANTIIINNADKLGLAQLYQLRGRVGRSDKQAYAYLIYKPDKVLSEIAEKRLAAIHEFSDLGSGFRIAMRDLEIRGAGNLLGSQQSGSMAAVGFDLYCQLLSQAVSELKGEAVEEIMLPPVDLPVDAYISSIYMPNEGHRILFYKKLAAVKNVNELQSIQDELEDRFGDPPKCVWNMLAILRLRLRCLNIGISSISTIRNQIIIMFRSDIKLPAPICREVLKNNKKHSCQTDRLVINPSSTRIISEVEDMVEVLAKAFIKAEEYLRWV